jgi:nitrate reductase alpha subunit
MTEVRYRGTKVVTVSPDYADNTKFADEWLAAQAGTDAALAMAMGHSYTIGLVLLTITASGALLFTLFGIRRKAPATS